MALQGGIVLNQAGQTLLQLPSGSQDDKFKPGAASQKSLADFQSIPFHPGNGLGQETAIDGDKRLHLHLFKRVG
jgi:hypothetical protein